MEIRLKPKTEFRLNELASKSGRPASELIEDAMAAYLTEVAELRNVLDNRYDDIKIKGIKPLDGEAFFEDLRRHERTLFKRRAKK